MRHTLEGGHVHKKTLSLKDMTSDPFDDALVSEEQLRLIYEPPTGLAATKEIDHVDDAARAFVACSSLLFVASTDARGRLDVTPRGGQPGFVSVLDDGHLVIPDATGNRRIDTSRNIVATGRAGLIFLIPGRQQTLRINGRACVTARPDLLAATTPVGKPPRTAIVVAADEVFTHCPKAFVRSKAWEPEHWLDANAQPSPAEVVLAHQRDPSLTIADVERSAAESLLHRLD